VEIENLYVGRDDLTGWLSIREFSANELAGIVDKIVDKQPAEWDSLET
jgi:hypothetical protein